LLNWFIIWLLVKSAKGYMNEPVNAFDGALIFCFDLTLIWF